MMCLTGARPSELLNINRSDIGINHSVTNPFDIDTQTIRIYSTKTKRERYFPINQQLKDLIIECCESDQSWNTPYLLHNSKGNKINLHNFSNRIWKPQITQLVKQQQIKEYLPLYNLRHTWITRMLNTPMENVTTEQKIKNIAYLAGTSQEMIFKHYQGLSKVLIIPEIDF